MNSQTISLYSSAIAMITVLVGFSKANRKSGWRKSRTTLGEAFQDFYSDMGFNSNLNTPAPIQTSANHADFTAQLLSLRGALGSSIPMATPVRSTVELSTKPS